MSQLIAQQNETPNSVYQHQFHLKHASGESRPYARYSIKMEDGSIISGVANGQGLTERIVTDSPQKLEITVLD